LRELFEHQQLALDYASSVTHPALLMEMRLGKTLVGIRSMQRYETGPMLVIAPTTPLTAWQDELGYENEQYLMLKGKGCDTRELLVATAFEMGKVGRVWVLMTPQSIAKSPWITNLEWNLVVCDESTFLKNPQSGISKLITDGFRKAKHRCIMTGSIRPENDLNVFQQFKFLDGEVLGCSSFWKFRNKFFEKDRYNWVLKYEYRNEIKKYTHARAFVMSRQDAGRYKDKIYSTRSVPMNDAQIELQQQIIDTFAYQTASGEWMETTYAPVKHAWLLRIAGGFTPDGKLISNAKANAVIDYIEETEGDQCVVWFKFRAELDYFNSLLEERGINYGTMSGGVSVEERHSIIKAFRSRKIQVITATEKVAKYGIDCSTADVTIYYSNEPSGEDRIQSEDRTLNIQKNEPLYYVDFMTKGSIEEETIPKLQDKTFDARIFTTSFDQWVAKFKRPDGEHK